MPNRQNITSKIPLIYAAATEKYKLARTVHTDLKARRDPFGLARLDQYQAGGLKFFSLFLILPCTLNHNILIILNPFDITCINSSKIR